MKSNNDQIEIRPNIGENQNEFQGDLFFLEVKLRKEKKKRKEKLNSLGVQRYLKRFKKCSLRKFKMEINSPNATLTFIANENRKQ